MSQMWRKTLEYLGLVEEPDEEATAHDPREDVARPVALHAEEADDGPVRGRGAAGVRVARSVQALRDVPAEPVPSIPGVEEGNVRRLRAQREGHVRDLPPEVRVGVVRPTEFDDAEAVGERYRAGKPVLLDLGDVDAALGRRLLDFVSGTIFALEGSIQPAGRRAFLLMPEGVAVSAEERRRLSELGYTVELAGAVAE
jgi:cell division inhibitor SepF